MSYTLYGLRLKGDREVRYIGQTNGSPSLRLVGHLTSAQRALHNRELAEWLLANHAVVEAFAIAKVGTRQEATAHERVFIALCSRLNHRLFNRRLMPAELKLVASAA